MHTLHTTPGALRILAISIVARLPLAMLGIGLLVHAVHLTGSFTAAGVVAGANAIAIGVGAPVLGRLVDRRGQTGILLASGCASGALLCVFGELPAHTPLPLLIGVASAIGATLPPVGACLRALLPALAADAHSGRAIYAIEASAVELTWVVGPPLALALAMLCSTGVAVAVAGVVLAAGAALFALQAPSRAWRPEAQSARTRGAMRAPAVQTLVLVFTAIGVLVGAVEVGAASAAAALGGGAGGGLLLGIWSVGSLAGGVVTARLGGGVQSAVGLSLVLAALAGGHLAAAAAAGDLVTLALALVVAGSALAPAFASAYAMVDRMAPVGAATEAFAWLGTALATGGAAGSAVAGALADGSGPSAAFALAGAAGVAAALVALLRARTLGEQAGAHGAQAALA